MKLLYLANIRLPTEKAHGIQIMKTCEAFASAGVEVELVVPTRHNALPSNPFSFYGVTRPFSLTTVRAPDFVRFGSLGFLVSALWFSEKVRMLKSFFVADLFYSRDAFVLFQYLLLHRPYIYEAHAKPSLVSRVVARRARRLVVISRGLKEAYEQAGVRPERIVVAGDAVDSHLFTGAPDRQTAREKLGFPTSGSIVVYAGHLYARKGADTAARAAALAPETLFVFVGGIDTDIDSFRQRWDSARNIRVIGRVPHHTVPLYLRAGDALLLPNSGKDEDASRYTSPMKLFEYMASGTPIIASRVPALLEVLSEETAYLVSPDDPTALAEATRNVLAHGGEASRKAAAAKAAAAGYTWEKRADTILASL